MSKAHVYLAGFVEEGNECVLLYFKVGKASEDYKARVRSLQTGCPHKIYCLAAIACDSADEALSQEKKLQDELKDHHVRGEWFCKKVPRLSRKEHLITVALGGTRSWHWLEPQKGDGLREVYLDAKKIQSNIDQDEEDQRKRERVLDADEAYHKRVLSEYRELACRHAGVGSVAPAFSEQPFTIHLDYFSQ